MKKLYIVLFVMAISLFVSCDRENADGISNEMAIKMSVSVDKTKAILTTDNIINTSIGVFGYKEQISNQNNKYLVFNNEKLSFESDLWAYSPVRYWDTQTAYSFIAYAPYQENSDDVSVNDFEGITINGIPQWQDADDAESKDYVVALTDSAATNYINNGGVDLKFHHILANLKITAFKEGDSDFEIQNITIGADIDNQRVPAVDAERSYVQNFGHERADGSFSNVTLNGIPISLFAGNMAVESAISKVANLLVAPFIAGADLPLTITYTENGTEKSAVVNSGITEFKSDAVYTVNLKFTSTVADEPSGPSGPGIEVVPGSAYAISDGGRNNLLSINAATGNLEVIQASMVSEYFWQTAKGTDFDGEENKQALYVEYNGVIYYLCADDNDKTKLSLTDNPSKALEFYMFQPYNSEKYLVTHDSDGKLQYVRYNNNSNSFSLDYPIYSYSDNATIYKMLDRIVCEIGDDGYAGPAIYFHIRWNNANFDFDKKCMDINMIQRLSFDYLITKGLSFGLGFDGINTRYSYPGNNNIFNPPSQNRCEDEFTMQWSVAAVDGSDISQYAEMQNNTLVYKQKCPVDTVVIVTLTCTHRTNPEIVKVGYYRLTLKGANSGN
ncbi:MAG: fimbrillin family protein [Bacteroidaceae bacterium]|nr:fimbrillin family protein [Bacteroidaceae bacterium]